MLAKDICYFPICFIKKYQNVYAQVKLPNSHILDVIFPIEVFLSSIFFVGYHV